MQRVLVHLQSKRVETHRELDCFFKFKVQLKEQQEENEVKIHFYRGVVAAYDDIEKHILALEKNKREDKNEFEGKAMEKSPVKIVSVDATAVLYEELYGASGEATE